MSRTTDTDASRDREAKEIAERILRFRKERGITQVELSQQLGITQPMVSRLEKGDYRLNGEIIISLARIFKVSADDILGLKTPTQEGTSAISRRWLKRLVKIETLPKRDQDGLIQTVDRYLKASGTI
jgi:transcriptional regulator with XRE-family HTH domain